MLSLRTPLAVLAGLAAVLAAAPAAADLVACSPNVPAEVICIGGLHDDVDDGPLEAGKVYHVIGTLTVPAGTTLTVEGGAIVKLSGGINGFIDVRGTLRADPGAIFTSVKDDTAGGDTNGDTPEVPPARGDWGTISFRSSAGGSLVDGAEVRWAHVGLQFVSSDPTVQGTTVLECASAAMDLRGTSFPTITGCSLESSRLAMVDVPLGALAGFSGNGASGNDLGDYVLVTQSTFFGNLTLGPDNSLDGRPFVMCSVVHVPQGQTLTLLPGTDVKFGVPPIPNNFGCNRGGFEVEGTLLADGVRITSFEDDTIAGDTNNDGSATLPMPGDWGYLEFRATSDASAVTSSLVRYGGLATLAPFVAPTVLCAGADVTLDGTVVELGKGDGMRLEQTSFPTVTSCAFVNNQGIAVNGAPLGAVPGFANNVAAGNAGGNFIRIAGPPAVGGVIAIAAANALNGDGLFVIDTSLTLNVGAELTLGGGVVFKWTSNRSLTVNGTLRVIGFFNAPVVFTSFADDSVLGDSNGDGSDSSPEPGDWVGIRFAAPSGASEVSFGVVRYAGDETMALGAVEVGSNAAIEDTIVELSESAALHLLIATFPSVVACSFRDSQVAVTGAYLAALPGFVDNAASGNAMGDYLEVVNGDVAFSSPGGGHVTIGPANALLPDRVLVLRDDIDVPAGSFLGVLGSTVFKLDGNREVDVDGTLQVGSVGGGTTVFTSFADDSLGGDTNGDGGATEGAPGDWRGLNVSSDGAVLQDVLVRFAGAAGITLVGANAILEDVVVRESSGSGLNLTGSSFPQVHGCELTQNGAYAANGVPIGALPGFANNQSSLNLLGDYLRITDAFVSFDVAVSTSQSPGGIPFVLVDDVDVAAGITLSLAGGVVFKFDGPRAFRVDGVLLCNGVPGVPVVLTTLADDIAGDTNKGGAGAFPESWVGLDFDSGSDASVLSAVLVRFAGLGGAPAIALRLADIGLFDVQVSSSGGAGLDAGNNSFPTVRRSSFDDGLGTAIVRVPLSAVQGLADNTGSGNAGGDHVVVGTGNVVGGAAEVRRESSLNATGLFVFDASVAVAVGQSLTFGPAVVVKWRGVNRSLDVSGGALHVLGTGLERVLFTPVTDDSVLGDTNLDGQATQPLPGEWGGIVVTNLAAPSHVEYATARFGGNPAFQVQSDQAQLLAVRADFAAGDGIRASAHAGPARNWVAFECGGDGIDLTGGAFDLLHATVTGCAGVGVRRQVGHAGLLQGSIAFGNAGGETLGFLAGEVLASNVGAPFAGLDGNIDADPLFANRATGSLGLSGGSPCIDAADLGPALATRTDHGEASRVLDHDLDGALAADMGAFERPHYAMSVSGRPKLGTTLSFTTSGAEPGFVAYLAGPLTAEFFLAPYGFGLVGLLPEVLVLGGQFTDQPFAVPLPVDPFLIDLEFGIQGLAVPFADTSVGNATNRYRGTIAP